MPYRVMGRGWMRGSPVAGAPTSSSSGTRWARASGSRSSRFGRLRDVGLVVKERHGEQDGALTGYAVALAGQVDADGVLLRRQARRRPHVAQARRPAGHRPARLPLERPAASPGVASSRGWVGGAGLSEAQRAGLWEQAIDAARQATAAVGAHRDDPRGRQTPPAPPLTSSPP